MVAKFSIKEHLEKLEEFIAILREYKRKIERKKFLSERDLQFMVEHAQLLTAESVLTISEMLIANYGFRKPEEAREIFEILAKEGIVGKNQVEKLQDIAGFRNVLVHDYIKLNLDKVYDHLVKDIPVFINFAKSVANYIK